MNGWYQGCEVPYESLLSSNIGKNLVIGRKAFFFSDLTSSLVLEDISTSLKVNAFCYWFCRHWSKFAHTKLEFGLVVYFFKIFGSDFVHLMYHFLIIIVIYIGKYLWILWSNPLLWKQGQLGASCSGTCPVTFYCLRGWWIPSISGQPVPISGHSCGKRK